MYGVTCVSESVSSVYVTTLLRAERSYALRSFSRISKYAKLAWNYLYIFRKSVKQSELAGMPFSVKCGIPTGISIPY